MLTAEEREQDKKHREEIDDFIQGQRRVQRQRNRLNRERIRRYDGIYGLIPRWIKRLFVI